MQTIGILWQRTTRILQTSAGEWAAYTLWASTSANECVKANAVWAHTSALEPALGTSSIDARLAHNHTASCILNIFPPPRHKSTEQRVTLLLLLTLSRSATGAPPSTSSQLSLQRTPDGGYVAFDPAIYIYISSALPRTASRLFTTLAA